MQKTQAEQIYTALRRKPHTYMEMLGLGVSVCPWKRATEGTHYLKPGESLVRGTNAKGLTTYRVQRERA